MRRRAARWPRYWMLYHFTVPISRRFVYLLAMPPGYLPRCRLIYATVSIDAEHADTAAADEFRFSGFDDDFAKTPRDIMLHKCKALI